MTTTVTIAGTPVAALVLDGVTISHGRQDLAGPVGPSTATVTILRDSPLGVWDANTVRVGDLVTITRTPPGQTSTTRFRGRVTDVTAGRDVATVVAVSNPLSQLGRLTISTAGQSGNVSTVIASVLAAALAQLPDPVTVNTAPGAVTVTVPPQTNVTAAAWLAELAAQEPAGTIAETVDGTGLVYRPLDRSTNTPAITFTGNELGQDWNLSKSVADRANTVTVDWTAGTITVDDPADIAAFGRYAAELDLWIDDVIDATRSARLRLTYGTNLVWQLDGATVPAATLTAARQAQIAAAVRVGALVEIPELIPGAQRRYFVEGWDELHGPARWDLTLYLSDAGLSRPPQTWDDAPPALTWSTVPAGLTWDDLLTTWI